MKGKSLSKKAIIAIVIIAILVIAAISMVVVFLRDQGETEATAIGENGSNSEQTQDAVPNNNDDNNQGTATQSEEPQQEEQTTVANNDGATTTNVGTTTPATTTTTTDGSTQVATITTTETIPTQALTLAWSNMTVSGGELLANLDADVTDVTAPVRLATNILKFGESNELREYYVKRGDTIYMYIAVNEELAHNPTFTLINNGKEYVMEDSLVEVRQTAEDRWDYSVKYVIPEDTDFVDGEITLKVSDIEDKGGNIIPDEDGPTNGHRVFYDGTAPRIIVKGTEGVNEPDEQYIGDAIQRIFSKVSFKFSDNLMLEGEYEVNDTLITGMTPATLGDANFAVIKNYLKQGENTIRTWDMAGNEYTYTFIYDSIAPVYSKLGILNKTRYVNDVKDLTYAKRGDEVRILISFTEKLAVEPTVKVFGKEYTATYRPQSSKPEQNIYYYMVDITMDETMPEGEIPFEVYGYADIAGNVGEKLDQTKINRDDYTKVIYDRTKPVVRLEGTGVNDYFRSDVIITAEDANLGTIHLRKNGELIKNYELGTPLTEEGNYEVVMSDKAGNKSEQINFTIDKTAPVIRLEGTGVNNNFRSDVKVVVEEVNAHNIKYRKDNDRWITVNEEELTFTEEGTYTIEVIDQAYNRAEVTFTIDKTAPVIKLEGTGVNNSFRTDVKATIEEADVHNIKYRKNSDRWITVNEKEITFTEEGTYTIEVIDQAYNRTEVTFTIDKTVPVIRLEGTGIDNDFRTNVKVVVEEANVHNIKYKDETGNWTTVNEKTFEITKEGTYTVEVIDKAYNKIEVTFSIDKTAPSIKPTADSVGNKDKNGTEFYSRIGFTVTDNYGIVSYDLNGDTEIIKDGDIGYDTIKDYLKQGYNTITVTDKAGNPSSYTFYYDSKKPVPYSVRINSNSKFDKSYAKVDDEVWVYVKIKDSLSVEPKIKINDIDVDTFQNGSNENGITYAGKLKMTDDMKEGKVTFEVYGFKDLAGNEGDIITDEDINTSVIFDKTPATVALNGESSIEIEAGSIYNDQGATVVDDGEEISNAYKFTYANYYADPKSDKVTESRLTEINTRKTGLYKIAYIYIDKAGNSKQATRLLYVVDTTKPTIKLNGDENITIEAGTPYKDEGATVTDNSDDTIENFKYTNINYYVNGELKKSHLSEVDVKQPGEYRIGYQYTDKSGNTKIVVRTLIVKDTTNPVVKANGKSQTLKVGDKYEELGATVTDNAYINANDYKITIHYYDENGNLTYPAVDKVDTSKVGEYKIAYTAIDTSGNHSNVDVISIKITK